MPPPPHPHEAMWQAYIPLSHAPIVAQEFINNDINTIEQLCRLSLEVINQLVKQIHRDNINGPSFPLACSKQSMQFAFGSIACIPLASHIMLNR
jgi:hypothetical protein